jgi:hypothetical protein
MHHPKVFFKLLPLALVLFVGLSCRQPANKTYTTYQELPDPSESTSSDWSGIDKGLHVSFVTIDRRFSKSEVPAVSVASDHSVTGWKGEKVSAQLLLWSVDSLEQIQINFSNFEGKDGSISSNVAKARFVRYVMTDEFADGCGFRKPADFDSSLSADVLDNIDRINLKGKTAQPVWLTLDIPGDARPGQYRSTVKITGKGINAQELTLHVKVLNQNLPTPDKWSFHLDFWQHPSAVARVNNLEMWSDAHFDAMKEAFKPLALAGQKVITATLNKDPWNVQTYDPYADMIVWTKNEDGTWTYDYTVFDKWVSMMMDIGIDKMINCYSLIPWNNELHYKDAQTGKFIDIKANPGTENFEMMWRPFLSDFAAHLKEKGWLNRTNIAMDERAPESLDAAFSILKEVAPELGVSFADNHKTYRKYPETKDISGAAGHPFSAEDLAERSAKGLNTTYYIYCGHDFPNTLTFSDPAEATYLGWYAFANGFNGLLRWSYNSWVKEPLLDSRFRTWPAGDTYIVYPGNRSSVRFERLIEGVQDFEKAKIITQKLEEKNQGQLLENFRNKWEKLKNGKRRADWNKELNEAKEYLNDLSEQI